MTTPSIYNDPPISRVQSQSMLLRHQVDHVENVQWMI
jgi:hypothetical protein